MNKSDVLANPLDGKSNLLLQVDRRLLYKEAPMNGKKFENFKFFYKNYKEYNNMEDTSEICPISVMKRLRSMDFVLLTVHHYHVFCMDCMVESMKQKRSCPLCRENLDYEVTEANETADYKLGFQVGAEFGYEEGYEEGKEYFL